ncbi:MAG: hypothetical protein NVSMB6_01470 [Burkholderiaceae bacterium]
MPELNRKTLRVALNMHTNSSRYLKAVATATIRFSLSGDAAGKVSDEHRARATDMLKERFKKERAQRDAVRAAEEVKQKAEQAQRKIDAEVEARTMKLKQLAEKFSTKAGR